MPAACSESVRRFAKSGTPDVVDAWTNAKAAAAEKDAAEKAAFAKLRTAAKLAALKAAADEAAAGMMTAPPGGAGGGTGGITIPYASAANAMKGAGLTPNAAAARRMRALATDAEHGVVSMPPAMQASRATPKRATWTRRG